MSEAAAPKIGTIAWIDLTAALAVAALIEPRA